MANPTSCANSSPCVASGSRPTIVPRSANIDELLEALKREHGEDGRPDLQPIPRATIDPEPVSGLARPAKVAQRSAGPQLPSDCDVAEIDIMRVRRRANGNGMAVLRGLRRDRLATTQDRRRVCDYARDHRLDMAVGRSERALRRAP